MREGGQGLSCHWFQETVRDVSPTFSLLNSEQYIRLGSLHSTMIEE